MRREWYPWKLGGGAVVLHAIARLILGTVIRSNLNLTGVHVHRPAEITCVA